ncbi:cannabinoid receptor 1-like [Clytia hemisphaerica]|uniref:cannabinoid receptor 1-like n=1 Tax=Clytia hemisphaerica TaxID=252671 RepID=UPI0034D3B140
MSCLIYFLLPKAAQLIATVIYSLSGTIAALGNTFCLIVLWQPSQRSKSNKILTSLAISDCIVGYVCFPLAIWLINFSQKSDTPTCVISVTFIFFTLWMVSCSTCSIILISYDRYILITKSSRYDDILTDRKIYIIMASYWFVTLIFSIICVFKRLVYYLASPLIIIVSVILLSTSYYFVWKAFQQSGKRISELSAIGNNNVEAQKRLKKSQRLAKKVLTLIIFYLAAFVPTIIFIIISLVQQSKPELVSDNLLMYTYLIMTYIGLSNSCCNFFIYILKDPEFKTACTRLLRRSGVVRPSNNTIRQSNANSGNIQ